MAVMKKTKIEFIIKLEENKVTETIKWTADDGKIKDEKAKALMISVWNPEKKETLRMDLWTKDMPIDEMKQFFHETLVSMSTSFYRATNDQKMSATMLDFCDYFAEKLDLQKK